MSKHHRSLMPVVLSVAIYLILCSHYRNWSATKSYSRRAATTITTLTTQEYSTFVTSRSAPTVMVRDAAPFPTVKVTLRTENSVAAPTRTPVNNQSSGDLKTLSPSSPPPRVLCIDGPFKGRTFNRIIVLASALIVAAKNGDVAIGLGTDFSPWYEAFLDPRDDVWLNYTGRPCSSTWTPKAMYFKMPLHVVAKHLQKLIPKASYRAQARAALAAFRLPVTTVHRRHLEGTCVGLAEQKKFLVCPNFKGRNQMNVTELVGICNLEFGMIANEKMGTSSVLLTDNQVPELDQTFPYVSNHSFPVQTWMMALSDIHYGNPFSTVDMVVYFWRKGIGKEKTMRPRACYH
jgi:hypothetical protein